MLLTARAEVNSQYLKIDSLVRIIVKSDTLFSFSNIQVRGSVSSDEASYAYDQIENAVAKYPPALILFELDKIKLAHIIKLKGQKISGTYKNMTIYLTTKNKSLIERAFHEQFALMLLVKYGRYFDNTSWDQRGNLSAIQTIPVDKGKISNRPTLMELYAKGFLSAAGWSEMKNDFSDFSASLFEGGRSFWKVVDSYSKIKEKTLLAINFYHQLNPIFTESWFRFLAEYRLF